MVSGTRALPKLVVLEIEGGSRAAAPKGSMTYAFTHMGNFFLLLLLLLLLHPPLIKFQSQGPNLSLEAQIPALRPKYQPRGPNPILKSPRRGFVP